MLLAFVRSRVQRWRARKKFSAEHANARRDSVLKALHP
jgi:hypothetical protein